LRRYGRTKKRFLRDGFQSFQPGDGFGRGETGMISSASPESP
jgi:hypothetical protein